jgi:hypothetical protein
LSYNINNNLLLFSSSGWTCIHTIIKLEQHKQGLHARSAKDFQFLREESLKRVEETKREMMGEQEKLQQATLEFESRLKEEV